MASNPFEGQPAAQAEATQKKNPFSSANRRAHVKRQENPQGFKKPGNVFRSASMPENQKPLLPELLANKNMLDQAEQKAQIEFQQAMAKQVATLAAAHVKSA